MNLKINDDFEFNILKNPNDSHFCITYSPQKNLSSVDADVIILKPTSEDRKFALIHPILDYWFEGDMFHVESTSLRALGYLMELESQGKLLVVDYPDGVDTFNDFKPYCGECGNEDLRYIDQYANGEYWGCEQCGNKFIYKITKAN